MSDAERARLDALARGRYLDGDLTGALALWNQLAQPRVHCVNVDGLVRTDRGVVIRYLDLGDGQLLTPEALVRAARRLDELPIASSDPRIRVDPEGASATVTPIVVERGLVPTGLLGWAPVGLRAAITQDVRLRLSSPFRRGEAITAAYRFSTNRPRGLLRLDAPAPWRLPGLVHVEGLVERQTYRREALGLDVFSQSRVRAAGSMSDWMTSWLRWEGGAAYDRIGTRSYLALEGSLNTRWLDDHLAVIASAGRWLRASETAFGNVELVTTARSTTRAEVPVLSTVVGVSRVSSDAPLALWPAASSAEGRGALLRAHPLRSNSIITGVAFGRTLVFANTEYERPVQTRFGTIGVAGFVDVAHAARRLDGESASPVYVDVGAGLRAGGIRVDLGYGLRDGRVRASAAYALPWGTR